ncbi:hypothetical protein [Oleiphilus sp. HI0066]|uniref:hypothetical protein n=1 Tax=unclassified Oleiphilus TaxID=2631174 RepID=UPI0035129C1D
MHVSGWGSLFTLHVIWPFFVDLGNAIQRRNRMGDQIKQPSNTELRRRNIGVKENNFVAHFVR